MDNTSSMKINTRMFTHTNKPQFQELDAKITNGKRWYTIPNGEKYASITTILGDQEKPFLKEWQQSLGIDKAKKETRRCADRGTAVHEMAEHYLDNIDNPQKGHDAGNVKMFNQLKFRLNKINNIRAQELPMFSEMTKVAGRVDCVGEYDGVLSIIDFKTSNNNKTDDMIEDYKLQCTAYSLMYQELFGVQIDQFVILIAVEKGMMPQVFKGQVDDYIEPLIKRINTFYNKHGE